MARFSERIGAKAPKSILQLNSMDDDLRNGLWNACFNSQLNWLLQRHLNPHGDHFLRQLWVNFFKRPIDELPYSGLEVLNLVRAYYFTAEWAEVYDFVEFMAHFKESPSFTRSCNSILEQESGYRFSGSELVPITDEQELASIQKASEFPDPLKPVRVQIQTAVELFSNRKCPDYRNSIKESISAVEAMCNILTGDEATLGQALKKLEDKGIELHEALKKSFTSLYRYTSDAEGIRHALLEEPTLDFDDAKFMASVLLVICELSCRERGEGRRGCCGEVK